MWNVELMLPSRRHHGLQILYFATPSRDSSILNSFPIYSIWFDYWVVTIRRIWLHDRCCMRKQRMLTWYFFVYWCLFQTVYIVNKIPRLTLPMIRQICFIGVCNGKSEEMYGAYILIALCCLMTGHIARLVWQINWIYHLMKGRHYHGVWGLTKPWLIRATVDCPTNVLAHKTWQVSLNPPFYRVHRPRMSWQSGYQEWHCARFPVPVASNISMFG